MTFYALPPTSSPVMEKTLGTDSYENHLHDGLHGLHTFTERHLPGSPSGPSHSPAGLVSPSTHGPWQDLSTPSLVIPHPLGLSFPQHHTLYLSLSSNTNFNLAKLFNINSCQSKCRVHNKNLIQTNSSHISLPPKYSYQLDRRFGYITSQN